MNEKTLVLVADDDVPFTGMVSRALKFVNCEVVTASNGIDALDSAACRAPDLVLLDVCMPGLSGWDVLARLREQSATRTTPVIMLTGCGSLDEKLSGFGLGADDYVTKPFSIDELRARVCGLLRRHREMISTNPLTRLPGSPSIQAEVERRIQEGLPFALLHADLDRFKAYNDVYGYARGDEAIRAAAEALRFGIADAGDRDGFVGHIGGDDFVVICEEDCAEVVAESICRAFDEAAPKLHDPQDAARGWIESADRRGVKRRSPLMSLTLGGVTTRRRGLDGYAKAAALASEMKAWLKGQRESGPSAWAFDQRSESPAVKLS